MLQPELPNTDLDKDTKIHCPLCDQEKKLLELRGHIGRHVLWCRLGAKENLTGEVSFRSLRVARI